jgi:hypothetical protein
MTLGPGAHPASRLTDKEAHRTAVISVAQLGWREPGEAQVARAALEARSPW